MARQPTATGSTPLYARLGMTRPAPSFPHPQERTILQFGKVASDTFTMDYSYPMTALQASGRVWSSAWLVCRRHGLMQLGCGCGLLAVLQKPKPVVSPSFPAGRPLPSASPASTASWRASEIGLGSPQTSRT